MEKKHMIKCKDCKYWDNKICRNQSTDDGYAIKLIPYGTDIEKNSAALYSNSSVLTGANFGCIHGCRTMKQIYLKVFYETNLFAGDFSNGSFYDGFIELSDKEADQFIEDFHNKGIVAMYPHKEGISWNEPVFSDKKEIFDFTTSDFNKEGNKYIKHMSDGYKYSYRLDVDPILFRPINEAEEDQ